MKRRHFLTTLLGWTTLVPGARHAMAQMPGMDMSHGSMPDMKSHGSVPGMNMDMPEAGAGGRIRTLPTGAPLPHLATLKNATTDAGHFEATLEAGPASMNYVPGLVTQVLAYNGTTPGPMIVATEGDRVKIVFKNRIPGQASTLHWHGLEVPPDQDGGPHTPVASGAEQIYEFTLPEGSAGSYWYHPHPHGHTAGQVYRGLAAPFIVLGKADPLSADLGDTTLFITSISLTSDGTIANNTNADLMNGREGDHVLVNGTSEPALTVPPGSSRRFRLYNATSGRFLRLSLAGHTLTLVGTDGGLLTAPVRDLPEIFLAPAERAEIIVDFTTAPGPVALMANPWERGWMGPGKPGAKAFPIMTFALSGTAVKPVPIPGTLREIAALSAPVARKRLEFSETMGMANGMMAMDFLINGKSFDMNRIDLTSRAGEIELWEIYNGTDMDHPLHIHGTQFQIVEREVAGKVTPAAFLAWKDTVNIAPRETVRIKLRFATPGQRMYHCHILEHEDNGMMGTLNVV